MNKRVGYNSNSFEGIVRISNSFKNQGKWK